MVVAAAQERERAKKRVTASSSSSQPRPPSWIVGKLKAWRERAAAKRRLKDGSSTKKAAHQRPKSVPGLRTSQETSKSHSSSYDHLASNDEGSDELSHQTWRTNSCIEKID